MLGTLRFRFCILFSFIVLCTGSAVAQNDNRSHFRIRYVINIPEIDSTFVDNSQRIADLREFLAGVRQDSTLRITNVWFRGTASPDGGYEFNRWLCAQRLKTFTSLVKSYVDIPDSLVRGSEGDIPWDGFREKVAESDLARRDDILNIIDEGQKIVPWFGGRHIDARLLKLKKMEGGKVWEELKSPILRDLRYGDAVFEYYRIQPAGSPPRVPLASSVLCAVKPSGADAADFVPDDIWTPRVHLKTNVVDLALLIANVAVEVDITRHLSFTLPIYYSAVDYFKSTIKFRNFGIQPEFRYWFRRAENDGPFIGLHSGFAYYNFAFDGQYRMQDHRGRTPAYGGGLSAGYRLPISRDNRWRVEFSLGAGVARLDYDLFDNTPDVRDGMLMGRKKKTYIGLDQAAVTFAYSFDLKPRVWRGGRRVK